MPVKMMRVIWIEGQMGDDTVCSFVLSMAILDPWVSECITTERAHLYC
jgi:hypothetical protein